VVPILVKAENYQCSGPYNSHGELLFCGILDQTEIILFLLEVMSELKRRGNGRKLNITGKAFIKGNLTLIQSRIVALGLSDLVELSGYLTEDELKRFYCRASVLLAPLPSGERSIARFPNKIGEYLASGRPVVTTAIGDIPNYLTEGESAFLVKPDDVVGFADAIIRILNNPGQAEQIGKNGATVAAKHFDPKANGKRITDLIKTLRAQKKSR
jgi:glycosyltransferase involved in cell wall biosynthesis